MPSSSILFKTLGCVAGLAVTSALVEPRTVHIGPQPNSNEKQAADAGITRRGLFSAGLAGLVVLGKMDAAFAFENKISTKYDDRPKRRGSKVRQVCGWNRLSKKNTHLAQPSELGVLKRKDLVGEEYLGLKHCGAAPNCFCSTDFLEDDPDHSIPAWIWPKELGSDKEKAFTDLVEVVNAYKPGQNNVDGGGFKIINSDPKKGYIYAQFESLKNGYIDDLEIAFIDGMGERAVQVRSSSRLGYLDYGVNAKRLNYITKDLKAKGWDAKGVEYDTHQNYVIQNELY